MENSTLNQYTFILGYKRGTYISQLQATDIENAALKWAKSAVNIKVLNLPIGEQEAREEIMETCRDSSLINGTDNVYCITLIIDDELGLLNVVECTKQKPKQGSDPDT